jgi:hypothetical protein
MELQENVYGATDEKLHFTLARRSRVRAHSHIFPRPGFSQRYYMLNYRREYMVLPYMTQSSTQLPSLAYSYLLGTLSKSVI